MKQKALKFEPYAGLRQATHRSKGVHVSDVVRSLYQQLYPGAWADAGGEPSEELRMQWECGFMWEDVFGDVFARRMGLRGLQQGELKKAGLVGTPDIRTATKIGETKLTRKSSSKWPDDVSFWPWKVQVQAYCWMSEPVIHKAVIVPLFINGDYSRGPGAKSWVVLPVEYTFTDADLARNWRMLTEHAKRMKREGVGK